jgi:hypothetical protein
MSVDKVRSEERDLIQRRIANFKANQKKFQQDREEYYTRTMADTRANRWAPRSCDSDRLLMGPSS